jgi:hypothetical protein
MMNFEVPGGQILVLWHPEQSPLTTEIEKGVHEQHLNSEAVSGHEVLQSHYSLLIAELETTPGQISPFVGKSDAARYRIFLTMKASMVGKKISAIYTFNINGLHGFQFGDAGTDELIQVQAYDSNDFMSNL